MRYIPHTPDEIVAMLKTIGVSSVDEIFAQAVPDHLRHKTPLNFPAGLKESALRELLGGLAERNINFTEGKNFIGAGAYYHYVPSVISYLVKRGEFLTAYTPYQPEVSQGTLQAIFEFQTMVCELTGMEVANASNYDLSTACAEALMMARRVNNRNKALVSRATHPHYRDVMQTYFKNQGFEIVEIPFDKSGGVDKDFIRDHLDDSVSAVLIQSPNFFGVIEDLASLVRDIKNKGALFIVATAEALAYAALASPGEVGADIAIGEGMSFGIGLNYGGPYLGLFATQEKYIRSMPGRIVGETVDVDGKRGYVLTLATREQHIRREKATSNICTNQGLCALMCAIYLSLMGPEGVQKLSLLNMQRIRTFENLIKQIKGSSIYFNAPKFNESVVELSVPAKDAVIDLLKDEILAGVDLSTYYPELTKHLLVCTTEMSSSTDIEVFTAKLARFL